MSHMCRSEQVRQVNIRYLYEGRSGFYFPEVDLARNSSNEDLKERTQCYSEKQNVYQTLRERNQWNLNSNSIAINWHVTQLFHPKFFHLSLELNSEHGNQTVSIKILKTF